VFICEDLRERKMMNLSVLEDNICVVHFKHVFASGTGFEKFKGKKGVKFSCLDQTKDGKI